MERRRAQRSALDVWPDHHRLTRLSMRRVNVRTPMTRSEQRLILLIWILSICVSLFSLAQLCSIAFDFIRGLLQAF